MRRCRFDLSPFSLDQPALKDATFSDVIEGAFALGNRVPDLLGILPTAEADHILFGQIPECRSQFQTREHLSSPYLPDIHISYISCKYL